MKLVEKAEALPQAIQSARAMALSSFGSDELILERAIMSPRHVEVQVFADGHGNVIHLGERDCSVQRRHQKVVEESPCPVMTPELRESMGAAAVEAARAIDYRGAGTVEFLLDAQGEFYFLEMNTRLQVEHPVTELVTGLDLVALQIKVARGEALGIEQAGVRMNGHAIEVRLYAEDPAKGFLPRTGRIDHWQPAEGEGVRIDAGIAAGQDITPYYDPMLAKVIAWGEDRETARLRLIDALHRTLLFGATTNRSFLIDVLSRDTFVRGQATTALIDDEFKKKDLRAPPVGLERAAMVAVLEYVRARDAASAASVHTASELLNWSSTGELATRFAYEFGKEHFDLLVSPLDQCRYRVSSTERAVTVELQAHTEGSATLRAEGRRRRVRYWDSGTGVLHVSIDGRNREFQNRLAFPTVAEASAGSGMVVAPMPGVVQDVFVSSGDAVKKGQRVAVVEAMKMQHDVLADMDGSVDRVLAAAGAQVGANDLLVEIRS